MSKQVETVPVAMMEGAGLYLIHHRNMTPKPQDRPEAPGAGYWFR